MPYYAAAWVSQVSKRVSPSCALLPEQVTLAYLDAEVARVRVSDNFAWIFARVETSPDEFIETKLFGPAYFNNSIQRRAHGDSGLPHSATSSAAMGWKRTGGRRTLLPSVERSAMRLTNSKNCVARTIE